ncbi:MAG: hypothetical protein K2Q09_00600 [Phycisphaerales bacterium]|nr:hypothetical protein [Phycisphaerales bacterium]
MLPQPPAPQPDPHLRAFLADRDEPCPACTYNLRGLATDRCPECNRELVLQLRLAEPRLGEWIAAIAAVAAMLGFNAMIFGWFLLEMTQRRVSGLEFQRSWSLMIFGVVAAVGLAVLIRARRRFGNLARRARLGLAVFCWLVCIASAVVFFAQVR